MRLAAVHGIIARSCSSHSLNRAFLWLRMQPLFPYNRGRARRANNAYPERSDTWINSPASARLWYREIVGSLLVQERQWSLLRVIIAEWRDAAHLEILLSLLQEDFVERSARRLVFAWRVLARGNRRLPR